MGLFGSDEDKDEREEVTIGMVEEEEKSIESNKDEELKDDGTESIETSEVGTIDFETSENDEPSDLRDEVRSLDSVDESDIGEDIKNTAEPKTSLDEVKKQNKEIIGKLDRIMEEIR